jgi:teichoic acid transport system permease protein
VTATSELDLDSRQAAELADRHGLDRVGETLPLRRYLLETWRRRSFMSAFAHAGVTSANSRKRLGQAWLVINPLLNAAVYFLIFGVILNTSRGVDNFIAFLTIGVFLFTYLQRCVSAGAGAITGNLGIVRSFHFPRAVLPLSLTYRQVITLGPTLVVMLIICLITGERPTWQWLALIPVLVLLTAFSAGLAMIAGRLNTSVQDFSNLLPFILRVWLYASGVFYSIDRFSSTWPDWAKDVLTYQPGGVYLEAARWSLMEGYQIAPLTWAFAAGWAIMVLPLGVWVFYRGERSYGRA